MNCFHRVRVRRDLDRDRKSNTDNGDENVARVRSNGRREVIGHLPGRFSRWPGVANTRGRNNRGKWKRIFILKRRRNTIIIIIRSLSPDWKTIVRHRTARG